MSTKQIVTNDRNRSSLAKQGPSSGRCFWQGNIGRHHASSVISKQKKWSSQENKIVKECSLYKVNLRLEVIESVKLWFNKTMFSVPQQRLVNQANTIHRNRWITFHGVRDRKTAKERSWKWLLQGKRKKHWWYR